MVRMLYDDGVVGGEAVTARDVLELKTFRIKLETGRYVVVQSGSAADVQAWADAQVEAVAAPPDRITQLTRELAQLRKDALGRVTAGKPIRGGSNGHDRATAPPKRTRRAQ